MPTNLKEKMCAVANHPDRPPNMNSCSKTKEKRCSEMSLNTTAKWIPKQRLVTKDLIRDLWIPRVDQPGLTAVVTEKRLNKVKKNAKIITEEEKEALLRVEKDEKEKLWQDLVKRKAIMEELDLIRKQNVKPNDLEVEAQRNAQDLCNKANRARLENEDEIKEMNELILCAKIQAIRDSQKAEKEMIKQQLKKAEVELDEMMERERVRGLKEEKQKAFKRKEECYEAAGLLMEQIDSNFENRILEREKKIQEGKAMKKYFEKQLLDDIEKMRKSKAKQRELLDTLIKENEEIRRQKAINKEISKQEDIVIAAYQKNKAMREEAAEASTKERKKQRELEIAKLREQQEKASDLQAEKDALRARRAQEEKERDYRRLEKERAMKNKKMQDDLKKHRHEMQQNQSSMKLLKAERDQKEFQALIEKNRDEMEKEHIIRCRRKLENLLHAKQIREQIEKKEKEKISEGREFFLEGIHKKQEEKIRMQRLDEMRKKKLNELKEYDIPENYLAHIQRKAQLKIT